MSDAESSDDEGGYQPLSVRAAVDRAASAARQEESRQSVDEHESAAGRSLPPKEKKTINLRLVRAATGIDDEDELLNITTLRLSWQGITHIDGLELYSHIRDLYLQHNDITTIENLDVLPSLEFLALGSNRIREIGDGLRHLRRLEVLDLTDNFIADIKPGSLPRSIRVINVSGNPFVSRNRHTYRRLLLDMLPDCMCIDGIDVLPEELEASTKAVMTTAAGAGAGAAKQHSPKGRSEAELDADDLLDGLGPLTISGAESRRALAALEAKRYGASMSPGSPTSSNPSPSQRRARVLADDDAAEGGAGSGRGAGSGGKEADVDDEEGDAALIANYMDRREELVNRFKTRALEQQRRTDALLEAMEERSKAQLGNAASRLRSIQSGYAEAAAIREKETAVNAKRTMEAFKAIGKLPPTGAAPKGADDDGDAGSGQGGAAAGARPSVSPIDPDML